MEFDEDPDFDDDDDLEPPLPADDRLWRHPSEMGSAAAGTRIELVNRRSTGTVVLATALGTLIGAAATVATLLGIGVFDQPAPGTVTERIAADNEGIDPSSDLAVASEVLPAIVRVEGNGPAGHHTATGVIVRDDGFVLTTDAVVDGAEQITVTTHDGTVHTSSMQGRDRRADLAVVKFEGAGLPIAAMPEGRVGDQTSFGDRVILIDRALPATPAPAISRGYVSSVSRWVGGDRGVSMYGMVQVDTEQRRGAYSAGGVLLDTSGAVLGIVTARGLGESGDAETSDDARPISRFATPFDHARRVFDAVIAESQFSYPTLGITGEGLTVEQAERLGAPRNMGVRIDNAEEGSAARQAGLREGDVILEFGRQPIATLNDLLTELRRHDPGDVVFVSYLRNGDEEITAVFLAEDPALP